MLKGCGCLIAGVGFFFAALFFIGIFTGDLKLLGWLAWVLFVLFTAIAIFGTWLATRVD